jgi:hypothetical protein
VPNRLKPTFSVISAPLTDKPLDKAFRNRFFETSQKVHKIGIVDGKKRAMRFGVNWSVVEGKRLKRMDGRSETTTTIRGK